MKRAMQTSLVLALLAPGAAIATNFDIASGFTATALRSAEEQVSCRHLQVRYRQRAQALETFAETSPNLGTAAGTGQLKDYVRQRAAYPVDSLYNETVYRLRYPIPAGEMLEAVRSSQSRAAWGTGLFEHQNPNGGFERIHYRILPGTDGAGAELEFDVRAADVCLAKRFELVFFAGCPLERIRFDPCDYEHGTCSEPGHWESDPFVVQWWKCESSSTLNFDLSPLEASLGRRSGRIGGEQP